MRAEPGRLKVAHIITKLAVGGAQESALMTCVGLDPASFEQILISGAEVDSEGSLLEEARRLGIRVELEPSLVRAPSPLRDLQATWRLVGRLRRYQPDIVHTHSSKAGFLGRLAGHIANVPVIVHSVHGWSFNDWMTPVVRRFYIFAERLAATMTDALVVESSTDLPKGLNHRIGRARQYALIRNGIDLDRFEAVDRESVRSQTLASLRVPTNAWVVGTVGRLAEQKDPLLMVDAFAAVAGHSPNAHFVWVGDGPLREETAARAARLGLTDRFHLVGLRRDVAQVLGSLDVFALSSRWEGLPRTITEAMAVGLPVVATSVDGTAEVVDHGVNGLLVRSGDGRALAEDLIAVGDDPELAYRLGRAGRQRARLFSSAVMNEDVAALYLRLASGGRPPRTRRPLKVLHVITGLSYGGAERQLAMLVQDSDPSRVVHEVISLTDLGPVGVELESSGHSVTTLGLRGGPGVAAAMLRLRRQMSRSGADLVQTWLYHGDLLGGLAARSLSLPVVWNVRMSWMDPMTTKSSTMRAARICARLSRPVPQRIIFNSRAGLESHARHGYAVDRGVVIGNAVDSDRFRPDGSARGHLITLLGVPDESQIIGHVARFDAQKGHEVVLDAMTRVLDSCPSAHLVLVGAGCGEGDEPISTLVRRRDLQHCTHLMGVRSDVESITPGFDVGISPSTYGESSSNAIAEALASGVPVVATDVGSARELVGDAGSVVSPGSAIELAEAIIKLLSMGDDQRAELKAAARRAAVEHDVLALCESYAALYEDVVPG